MITNSTGVLPAVQNATNVPLWYRSFAVFLVLTITSQHPLLTRITFFKILLGTVTASIQFHQNITSKSKTETHLTPRFVTGPEIVFAKHLSRDHFSAAPPIVVRFLRILNRQSRSSSSLFPRAPETHNRTKSSAGRSNKIGTTRQ